jgi:ribosomal protein S21
MIDQLRSEQKNRLSVAFKALQEAKKHLENAVALTEAREREFREASEDVRRRIEALDLVAGMAKELDDEIPPGERSLRVVENHPVSMLPGNSSGEDEQLIARKVLAAMDRVLGRESELRNQAA